MVRIGKVLALSAAICVAASGQSSGEAPSAPKTRRLTAGPPAEALLSSRISLDGRLFCWTDSNARPVVYDNSTGTTRMVSDAADSRRAASPLFSPDAQLIAYIATGAGTSPELRIVKVDGSSSRRVSVKTEHRLSSLDQWSSDGKFLLVRLRSEKGVEIALLSTEEGTAQVLTMLSGPPQGLALSPDGKYVAYGEFARTGTGKRDIYVINVDTKRSEPLVATPTDDLLMGWSPGGTVLFTSTPHGPADLFGIEVRNGKAAGEAKLIQKGLGDGVSVGITSVGDLYYVLRPSDSNIFTVTIDAASGRAQATPELTLAQAAAPSWSPDGLILAYATHQGGHGYFPSFAFLRDGRERAFAPKLQDHRFLTWAPDGSLITFGADAKHAGWFRVNAQTGATKFLTVVSAEDQIGLPEVSPDNKSIYFRSERRSGIFRRNLTTGKENPVYEGPAGASFRCVRLSPDGKRVAFLLAQGRSQSISVLPVSGGSPREIVRVERPEVFGLNSQPLAWSADGQFIYFVRSNQQVAELYRVPAAGGTAVAVGVASEGMGWLHAHPDGKRLSFSAGHGLDPELWVVSGALGHQ